MTDASARSPADRKLSAPGDVETVASRRLGRLAERGAPLAYAIATLLLSTRLRLFEASSDEGFNLAKGALLARGHSLYGEIWSDQPPLFTAALRGLFSIGGESVLVARLLVLAFACLLLASVARVARRLHGGSAAIAALLVLLVAPPFQQLSVAVMIGLPALALAMLAFAWTLDAIASGRRMYAALAGAALGLGVLTKLFVAPLVPILAVCIVAGSAKGSRVRVGAAFGASCLATAVAGFLLLAGPQAVEQLFSPHLRAAADPYYREAPRYGFLAVARPLWPLALLAIAGVVAGRSRREAGRRALLAWTLVSLAILAVHRPVWRHHLLLLTVPASLLAAPALVAAWEFAGSRAGPWLRARRWRRVAAGVAASLLATGLLAHAGRWRLHGSLAKSTLRELALVERVRSLARPGDHMLTDSPMHAFRAGVGVLPETAVPSQKRMRSGFLSERRLRAILEEERPALVLFHAKILPGLQTDLRASYRLMSASNRFHLYALDRADRAPTLWAWPGYLEQPRAWYATDTGRRLAEGVLRAQHEDGGWGKNEDRWSGAVLGTASGACDGIHVATCSTIDNGATTGELAFLAKTWAATGEARYADAFLRGLDHLLGAQTPSGGWPQVPSALRGTYHAAVTLNDDAMAHVMALLDDVLRDPAYAFVDEGRRDRVGRAFARGVDCLLRAQVRIGGTPTVWCAQHDPDTLAPVGARAFEPASLSGEESVGVVRILLRVERPPADVREAVEGAVEWLRRAPRVADGGVRRWARFYDLATQRPLYADRYGEVHATLEDLPAKQRARYRYTTDAPAALLDDDYPRWRTRIDAQR